MILLELSETQMASFDKEPEAGMSTHFARIDEEVGFVLGGRVLTLLHTDEEGRSQSDELCNRLWFGRAPLGGSSEASIAEENGLISALAGAPPNISYVSTADPLVAGFILNSPGYLPPSPSRPSYMYGHLPFTGVTHAGDVFYRCEHWATSRRVLQKTNQILAGTYAFPSSELAFVPTGFAVAAPAYRCMVRQAVAWK